MEIEKDYFELQKQKQRTVLLESVDFYNKIDYFYELIDRLSQKNFESIRFINQKRKILCQSIGMNATLYSLKGIKLLCEIGDIIDAFTLLRKIRDNLCLDRITYLLTFAIQLFILFARICILFMVT